MSGTRGAAAAQGKREALELLAGLERREAVLFAQRAVALTQAAELWTGQDDPAAPYLALDVAVACQIAQVTASNRMAQAQRLIEDLPCTLQGLLAAVLTVGQAIVLLEETKDLPPALVQQLDRTVQDGITGLTAGDTRRLVKIRLIELDALAAEARPALYASHAPCHAIPGRSGAVR